MAPISAQFRPHRPALAVQAFGDRVNHCRKLRICHWRCAEEFQNIGPGCVRQPHETSE